MARTLLLGVALWCAAGASAHAQGSCVFDFDGATMRLLSDCATDTPIVVPDGFTLDGAGHVIRAVDPAGGAFRGGIVTNGGAVASVIDTTIMAPQIGAVCQSGVGRLRGILFEGASGIIRGNRLLDITRGTSACQEGHAIEIRALDGISAPVAVEIAENVIDGYQKAGVVVTGHVDAWIHHNHVGSSAMQAYLPANAVQVGGGARAIIEANRIEGNSWPHADAAATGILLLASAPGTVVRGNTIAGNADVGIYVLADGAVIAFNLVEETGPDGFYDIGIGNYGEDNLFVGNVVRGYATPMHGVTDVRGGTRASLE